MGFRRGGGRMDTHAVAAPRWRVGIDYLSRLMLPNCYI